MRPESALIKVTIVAVLLAIAAGVVAEPRGLRAAAAPGYAFADLQEARRSHVRWGEVEKARRDREALIKEWQSFVDGYGLRTEEVRAQKTRLENALDESLTQIQSSFDEEVKLRRRLFDRALGDYREELMREVKQALEEKKKELAATLEDDVYAFALSVNQQADEYLRKVAEEYNLPMLNLNLKLSVLTLTDEERKRLSAELEKLRNAMADKIKARQDEAAQDVSGYVKRHKQELDAQLAGFEAELSSQVEARLDAERNRLEMEFTSWRAQRLAELEAQVAMRKRELQNGVRERFSGWEAGMMEGFKRREAEFDRRQQELRRSEDAVLAAIDRDIRLAAARVSRKLGITVKLQDGGGAPTGARDVTDMVIDALRGSPDAGGAS